jgi:hypothetical protein
LFERIHRFLLHSFNYSAQRWALAAVGGSVDSPSKRKKLEARQKPKKRGTYPPSAACRVGGRFGTRDSQPEKDSTADLTKLWHVPLLFSTDKYPDLKKY